MGRNDSPGPDPTRSHIGEVSSRLVFTRNFLEICYLELMRSLPLSIGRLWYISRSGNPFSKGGCSKSSCTSWNSPQKGISMHVWGIFWGLVSQRQINNRFSKGGFEIGDFPLPLRRALTPTQSYREYADEGGAKCFQKQVRC